MLKKYDLHPVQMGKSIAVLDEVHLLKQCEKAHPEYPPIPMTENKLHNQGIPLFSKNLPILKMGENLEVDLKEILTETTITGTSNIVPVFYTQCTIMSNKETP